MRKTKAKQAVQKETLDELANKATEMFWENENITTGHALVIVMNMLIHHSGLCMEEEAHGRFVSNVLRSLEAAGVRPHFACRDCAEKTTVK